MTTITLKDEFFTSSIDLGEEGSGASDVLRAFTGLMLANTFSIGTVIRALDEVSQDLKETIKLANDVT